MNRHCQTYAVDIPLAYKARVTSGLPCLSRPYMAVWSMYNMDTSFTGNTRHFKDAHDYLS